ncbi:MAG: hypothetical protein HYY85_09000 [Deltaproteobacteria bacterium]|nr:hypothetical protein [Deltaproteobacteria bacterium]
MSDERWNPCKMTAIGMALVIATALVTGLVVANWSGKSIKEEAQSAPAASRAPARRAATTPAPRVVAMPSAADIEACNQYAKAQVGSRTSDVLTDALIGGAIGAGVGAAGGAIAGGGKNAGKGAAIGGVVGATAGTLHGLNKANATDPRYVDAYRACMRGRGF